MMRGVMGQQTYSYTNMHTLMLVCGVCIIQVYKHKSMHVYEYVYLKVTIICGYKF